MDEKKKKIFIFAGSLLGILIGGFMLINTLNSDEEAEKSEDFSTPESQRQAYNSKLEAYKSKKEVANVGTFEERFSSEEKENTSSSEKEEAGLFDAIDKQIANMGATPPSESETKKQNTHNVYGDYSMWETQPKEKKVKEARTTQPNITKKEDTTPEKISVYEEEVNKYLEQEQPKTTKKQKKEAPKFEDLPLSEQRRIKLETGGQLEDSQEISAVVFSTGRISTGQMIAFRTTEDAVLSFKKIPKGTIINGEAMVRENRLEVRFSTIKFFNKNTNKKETLKVNFDVYSTDGVKGLPIEGGESVTQETEEEATEELVSHTGRIGRALNSINKAVKRKKDLSVDLGKNIKCTLVNNNIEQ